MSLLTTDAVVLHAFDYLESSRILRLVTREAGVQSVVAKGARRARSRYGSALDLFAQGTATMYLKSGRDLHTLSSFDVTRARPQLAADLGRFTGASAIAELILRFTRDEAQPSLYDAVVDTLDAIGRAEPEATREAALAGAWRIVGELGFAPALDVCGSCHAELTDAATLVFSHPAGGVLCARCARMQPGGRAFPATARDTLRHWLAGEPVRPLEAAEARAHQRLLREFLREHLTDGRGLRAFEVWEHALWSHSA